MVSISTEKGIKEMYKLLAISKTKHGTTYFAVVDENAVVEAIIKVNDGWCYDIRFIETSPSENRQVIEFIKEQERKHLL